MKKYVEHTITYFEAGVKAKSAEVLYQKMRTVKDQGEKERDKYTSGLTELKIKFLRPH
ncbi:hypothetical protein [Fictibacillus macauensis]|uniref:hypothetical protein n=1 Tax=Fictibacillus macauensis TaxID=245160 RepID=UPI0002F6B06E|nr:hypothetical protein [Fictibacillus macauensis]